MLKSAWYFLSIESTFKRYTAKVHILFVQNTQMYFHIELMPFDKSESPFLYVFKMYLMFRSFLTLWNSRVPKVCLAQLLFPTILIKAHISAGFLTETIPDGVHDGKDEVEAVADVERYQDVVETVPHFSPTYFNLFSSQNIWIYLIFEYI